MPEIEFPTSLSAKQKKAVKYLAQTNLSKAEIAERLGVSQNAVGKWTRRPDFIEAIDSAINQIEGVDQDFRRIQVARLLPTLYEELQVRAVEGDLEEVSTKKLVDIVAKLQHEQRLDTPGDVTSKTATGSLDTISDRYQDSLSGSLHKKKKLKPTKGDKVVNMGDVRGD